jgi:hypothetical protein
MADERTELKKRIADGKSRLANQRDLIGLLRSEGGDTSAEIMLLSAMESGQAIRLRRLAALSL